MILILDDCLLKLTEVIDKEDIGNFSVRPVVALVNHSVLLFGQAPPRTHKHVTLSSIRFCQRSLSVKPDVLSKDAYQDAIKPHQPVKP